MPPEKLTRLPLIWPHNSLRHAPKTVAKPIIFARDVLDPDVLHIAERWRDGDALNAHSAAPHVATFGSVIAPATLLLISVKSYDDDTVRTLIGE